ncbi:MAG: hypothetical protein C0467_10405 [Planctomycetaceae bacterium]|nr:hypothetical protein [Planctomycetaceae bacterium]
MLLADTEGFWKSPNVYDVLGAAGFVISVASIWLAWWLAKRDIEKRLAEASERASAAARDEVRRVARAVLHSGVATTIRSLELAREACNGKRWPRAVELCILAREQLARVLAQPAADEALQTEVREVSARLQDCVAKLRKKPKLGAGEIPEEVQRGLDESIVDLHRVESRMTGIRLGNDHG